MNAFSIDRAARALAAAALLAATGSALAESNVVTTGSATARLNFNVTIPRVLLLQVGTVGAPIDTISFTVPANTMGDGTAIAGTGGNGTGGVTARVLGNNGTVTLSSSGVAGPLVSGTDSIPYSQLSVNVATLNSATALAHPALNDTGVMSVPLTPNVGTKVTSLDATWTYQLKNSAVYPAGSYAGQLTYTAAMP